MGRLSRYQDGLTARDCVRIMGATVLAAMAGLLAWLGLVWRFGSNEVESPLGASKWVQIGAPIALALLMIGAAWLLRGVVLARLQVAVLISLLAHLFFLFLLQLLQLPTLLAQGIEPDEVEGAQELVDLPEYGGMEAPDANPDIWRMDVAVDTPQRRLQDERQSTEPERPREREMQEAMPDNRIDPATLQQAPIEQTPNELQQEMPLERLTRQTLHEPVAPDAQAEAPEVSTARVAEMTSRDVSADLTKQSVDANIPTRQANREQLPDMSRRTAADQQMTRTENDPTISDQAQMAASRRSQSPTAVESPIEAARLSAERGANEFTPTESTSALERRRAELARSAGGSSAAQLGEARGSSANLSAARAERSPDVSGGSGSASMARSSSGTSVRGTDGQIDSPQVTGGSAAAGAPSLEPGRSGLSRSATGGVSGPRGSAPSLGSGPASGATGSGSAPSIGRVQTRDSIGAQSGPGSGGGSPASLGRGNVGGGVTGATGAGESVQVSERAGGSGGGQMGIAAAPGASSVGRSAPGQVPTRVGSGTGGAGPGLGPTRLGSGTGATGGASNGSGGSAGSGTAGRGNDPNPRLGSDTAGSGRPGGGLAGRSAPSSGVPTGVSGGIENEAMGLTPGPQPGGGLTGGPQPGGSLAGADSPGAGISDGTGQRTSVARRSAGLPGGSGGVGGDVQSPAGALAGVARGSIGAPARRGLGDTPEMHPLVSKLSRQVPGGGLGTSGQAEMSPAFSLRSGEMRKEAARTLGGTPETERAVEMGIAWLAQHQAPDGSWGVHDFTKQCKGHECDGVGSFESPTAGTGLALLAFLGAGYTHKAGQYQDTVTRGLKWLVGKQKADGDLFASEVQFVRYYSHGIAAIALCEAYGMTKDPELRDPTQKALQFILDSQHPQLGGWRYESRSESDTSVSGWQLMALKSGEMAGFSVPPTAYQSVTRWLDTVERGSAGGLYAYHPTRRDSVAMTAEGLLMRQYLGFSRQNPRLRAGADHLDLHLPDLSQRDAYYWYYATQMMYHMQGTHWEHWNGRLRDMLTGMQSKEGGTYGSWSPSEPTPDRWGDAGGRLYVTCMHLLMLEVYYRHLPLYQQLEQ